MSEYAANWSGGKDCCLALWKTVQKGLKVGYLLNMTEEDSTKSVSHGLDKRLIALQAEAMAFPIVQRAATRQTYEANFKAVLAELKEKGVTGLVTGDIFLQVHRDWIERVCRESGMEAMLPLWEIDTYQLLRDFTGAGFKTIIVSVKADVPGKDWLGKEISSATIVEFCRLTKQLNIDPCGESGEFHTFVYDGPLFKRPVRVKGGTPVLRGDRWFLDIKEYRLG